MFPESKVHLCTGFNVVEARQNARRLARELGFGLSDQARIATAVSEVATRAVGNQGTICFSSVSRDSRRGLECACDGCEWRQTADGHRLGITVPKKAVVQQRRCIRSGTVSGYQWMVRPRR